MLQATASGGDHRGQLMRQRFLRRKRGRDEVEEGAIVALVLVSVGSQMASEVFADVTVETLHSDSGASLSKAVCGAESSVSRPSKSTTLGSPSENTREQENLTEDKLV